jgi:hypothetical protein
MAGSEGDEGKQKEERRHLAGALRVKFASFRHGKHELRVRCQAAIIENIRPFNYQFA